MRRQLPAVAASAIAVAVALACPLSSWAPVAQANPPPAAEPEARPVRWVDAYARSDGDGSAEHPFRSLGTALLAGRSQDARLQLRAGLYPGPFELPAGASLEGPESAVLYVDGAEGSVVFAAGDAALLGV